MPTTLKRVPANLDDTHRALLKSLHVDDTRLIAARDLLGANFTVPASEGGAATALLTALLDRLGMDADRLRLQAFYRDVMFSQGDDDDDDVDGLTTDRALATAASEFHGDDDTFDSKDFIR